MSFHNNHQTTLFIATIIVQFFIHVLITNSQSTVNDDYPTIVLNTETVAECDSRNSGVYFEFIGETIKGSGICYNYVLTRYDKIWNCDDAASQTWSYLILDPCPNTPNGESRTRDLMNQAVITNGEIDFEVLGAFYDSHWDVEGYLFHNLYPNDTTTIHINFELCLDTSYKLISNGKYCFYTYYDENAEDPYLRRLPSGKLVQRPRRGRMDFDDMRNNRRRRRRMTNQEKILKQQQLQYENENENDDNYEYNNEIRHLNRRRTQSDTVVYSGSNNEDTGQSETEGHDSGVTYYVCSSTKVAVPDICGESD